MQNVLKLILNSSYGKTIQSTTHTKFVYKKNGLDEKAKQWLLGKFHMLKEFREITPKLIEAEIYDYDESLNLAHYGSLILGRKNRTILLGGGKVL